MDTATVAAVAKKRAMAALDQAQACVSELASDPVQVKLLLESILRGRNHLASLLLLLLEAASGTSGGGSTGSTTRCRTAVFGKALVSISGLDLLFTSLERPQVMPASTSSSSAEYVDGEFTSYLLGLLGASATYAGLVGPEHHRMAIVVFALTKLGLGFFSASAATAVGEAEEEAFALAHARHHFRSGAIVFALAVLLVWRGRRTCTLWWGNRGGKGGEEQTSDSEDELRARIAELTAAIKQQSLKLETL